MALGSLAHWSVLRRGRAQAHAGLPGRTRVPGPPSYRVVDRPRVGRECGEPRSAARVFDAGGNPGFCPRFLHRRRAPGARLAAAGRTAPLVRAGTVRRAGRGDPRRPAGGAARHISRHPVAHSCRTASCARDLQRRQRRPRRRRGAAARPGGAWRACAAPRRAGTSGHLGLGAASAGLGGNLGRVVVEQPTALARLPGPAAGAARNCDHRSGQA